MMVSDISNSTKRTTKKQKTNKNETKTNKQTKASKQTHTQTKQINMKSTDVTLLTHIL
jgi:hypothetical protein